MKFVSYNIQYGIGLDDRLDLPRIVSSIHGADIIALQEVTRNFHCNGGIDMVAELQTLAAELEELTRSVELCSPTQLDPGAYRTAARN